VKLIDWCKQAQCPYSDIFIHYSWLRGHKNLNTQFNINFIGSLEINIGKDGREIVIMCSLHNHVFFIILLNNTSYRINLTFTALICSTLNLYVVMWIKETDNDNSIFKNIKFSNIRRRMNCYNLWHLKVQCIRQIIIFAQNESKTQLTALWTVANLVVELCQCISSTSWRWMRSGHKDPRIFNLVTG
jgi:hypothetical protein